MAERLTVGVAARLSRYLQVLTQARKTGKERISSQEIAEYTNINATQIRRDLSAFGKFGKRGVGYRTDALLDEIRKILRTQGQHNIALVGAGRLGSAIASSPIFAEHGITIAAIFDRDPDKVGQRIGDVVVSPSERMIEICRDRNIIVGVIALFFGLYGFVVANNPDPNTFGVANLEIVDNIIHLVVAAWAFASALVTRPSMEPRMP